MTDCVDISPLVSRVFPRLLTSMHGTSAAVREVIVDVGELAYQLDRTGSAAERTARLEQLRRILDHVESLGMARSQVRGDSLAEGIEIGRRRADLLAEGRPEHELPAWGGLHRRPLHPFVGEVASDLRHLWQYADHPSFFAMLEEMSRTRMFTKGGQGVLEILRRLGFQNVSALQLPIHGPAGLRVYDFVLTRGANRYLVEVKNWFNLAHGHPGRWSGATTQLLHDLQRQTPDQIHWIFHTETPLVQARAIIMERLANGVRRQLIGRRRRARVTALDDLRDVLTRLEGITDLEGLRIVRAPYRPMFMSGGQFSPQEHRRVIAVLRDFVEHFNSRVWINPG